MRARLVVLQPGHEGARDLGRRVSRLGAGQARRKVETISATAKGEAIAEALMARRALLVLDGVEPLQHGPVHKRAN